jgi:hypothetical protein
MRIPSNLRTAIVALSLVAPLGITSVAFADNGQAVQQEQQAAATQQPTSSSGPYDGQDFVIPLSQTY